MEEDLNQAHVVRSLLSGETRRSLDSSADSKMALLPRKFMHAQYRLTILDEAWM
jgi:hypothetical protein